MRVRNYVERNWYWIVASYAVAIGALVAESLLPFWPALLVTLAGVTLGLIITPLVVARVIERDHFKPD